MKFKIYRSNEAELIKDCLLGKREAQRQLYDIYSPVMYPLCCRYMKNRLEAEDVLVIAFTKVFDKIHQFKGTGSFEGWIKRIVINEALTHLRQQREMVVLATMEDIENESEPDYDNNHIEEEELLEMISRLPPGYRSVFNMYAIDGYSHKEIAQALGISENTSKSQLSRARTFLQKLLVQNESMHNDQKHGITNG